MSVVAAVLGAVFGAVHYFGAAPLRAPTRSGSERVSRPAHPAKARAFHRATTDGFRHDAASGFLTEGEGSR